jgi:hypothetical protein
VGVLLTIGLLFLLGAADMLLLGTHMFKMTRNITSNEMINRARLSYISKQPLFSAYDKGTWTNVALMLTGYAAERESWFSAPPVLYDGAV